MSAADAPLAALAERLKPGGTKRILAIDGGGVRGALAMGMLTRIEATLREKLGRPDLVLSDYFDLIGGTSTGAIVASGLALGRTCENVAKLYANMGPRIFGRNMRVPLLQARFDPRKLQAVLEEELGVGSIGAAPWKTGFAAIAKRVDTGSPWILTNCPHAMYWDGDPTEEAREPDPAKRTIVPNKEYPLARVVQASAAAPFFFDLVPVEVIRGQKGIFFDGGISPHNNPSLQLALTALTPGYGFSWESGADKLMIVSVGTGLARPRRPEWVGRRVLALFKAMTALLSVTYDTSQLAISLLQWLGQTPQPWPINSEVGGYCREVDGSPMWVGVGPGAPNWTYVRYDAPLESHWLTERLGSAPADTLLKAYGRVDGAANIPALLDIGAAVAKTMIRPEHFPAVFDPPASPPGAPSAEYPR
jgi:hypothetical protein